MPISLQVSAVRHWITSIGIGLLRSTMTKEVGSSKAIIGTTALRIIGLESGQSSLFTHLTISQFIISRISGEQGKGRQTQGVRPSKGRFLCFNTSCHPMDNESTRAQLLEHFLSFFLPEGILDFFELVWAESQSLMGGEPVPRQQGEQEGHLVYRDAAHVPGRTR